MFCVSEQCTSVIKWNIYDKLQNNANSFVCLKANLLFIWIDLWKDSLNWIVVWGGVIFRTGTGEILWMAVFKYIMLHYVRERVVIKTLTKLIKKFLVSPEEENKL